MEEYTAFYGSRYTVKRENKRKTDRLYTVSKVLQPVPEWTALKIVNHLLGVFPFSFVTFLTK